MELFYDVGFLYFRHRNRHIKSAVRVFKLLDLHLNRDYALSVFHGAEQHIYLFQIGVFFFCSSLLLRVRLDKFRVFHNGREAGKSLCKVLIAPAVLTLMLRTYACIRVGESERKFDPAVFKIDLIQSQLLRNSSDGLFRLRHLRSAETVVDRRCLRISEFVILNARRADRPVF